MNDAEDAAEEEAFGCLVAQEEILIEQEGPQPSRPLDEVIADLDAEEPPEGLNHAHRPQE